MRLADDDDDGAGNIKVTRRALTANAKSYNQAPANGMDVAEECDYYFYARSFLVQNLSSLPANTVEVRDV